MSKIKATVFSSVATFMAGFLYIHKEASSLFVDFTSLFIILGFMFLVSINVMVKDLPIFKKLQIIFERFKELYLPLGIYLTILVNISYYINGDGYPSATFLLGSLAPFLYLSIIYVLLFILTLEE